MWFSGRDCVGIVRVYHPHEGIKYYIGTGIGDTEENDKQRIAEWGAYFPKYAGDVLFAVDEYRHGENED